MEKDVKLREFCLAMARELAPQNKDQFATVEDVIEAARKLEKYILNG